MKKLLFLCFAAMSIVVFSQENKENIDPSKPTNLYTQVNAQAELNSYKGYSTYGTRFNFQYAVNKDNLLLVEVPFLFNNATKKIGLSDTRVRYFNVQRLSGKTLIALAPFADIYIPTGKSAHGLGGGTWSLSAGLIAGLVFSENISMFPGLSYVYLTGPKQSGLQIQSNVSLKFSDRTFAFVNPSVMLIHSDAIWQAELDVNHIITPNKFKINAGWLPNFTNKVNTFRVGVTFYL
ncbi:hypothetical protein [Elizabethkingia miricola]|uniref:hypothetical protein n=1 Tax=Elizabethkingia miricola TaxID=172045 RepID=UPI002ACE8ED9|nr:hypothetical protein [Elizabethkingia miricola]WQM39450.1 hypothetical protein U2S95_04135 [Elizabethkingia miricola]